MAMYSRVNIFYFTTHMYLYILYTEYRETEKQRNRKISSEIWNDRFWGKYYYYLDIGEIRVGRAR